jgi:hypothetical protein
MKNITSMQNMAPLNSANNALNSQQLLVVSSLGVLFWFVFAMLIQLGNRLGTFGGAIGAMTFLGSIPVAWLLILVIKTMAGLTTGQIFTGLGISSAIAGLCDGIALTWHPSLYGSEASTALLGAAYILWGVGVILILAYVMDNMAPNKKQESLR